VPESENPDFALEDHISGEVGERVRSIISAAESAAEVIRHQAEQEIAARKRIAETERARYLDAARQEADDLLRRRVQRMTELSDSLVEGAERLLGRMESAEDLRRQLDRTVAGLAQAAERLAAETDVGRSAAPPPAAEPPPPVVPVEAVDAVETVEEAEERPIEDVEVADVEEAPVEPHLHEAPPVEEASENGARRDADPEGDDVLAARLVALQMAVAGCPRGEVEEHLRNNFAVTDTTTILNDVFGSDVPRIR
jgi:hypothetical protein